jgi:hypothetical protein
MRMGLPAYLAAMSMAGLGIGTMESASAKDFTVTVSAMNHDYRETPVKFTINAPADFAGVALFEKDAPVPVQVRLAGKGKAEVAFILHSLKKGQSVKYRLAFEKISRPVPTGGVIIDKSDTGDLDIRINNELFTRYDTHTGPNKPFFYPVFAPGG